MTYTKNTWLTGDTVTAQKLNNMEDGIEAAGYDVIIKVDFDYDNPSAEVVAGNMNAACEKGYNFALGEGLPASIGTATARVNSSMLVQATGNLLGYDIGRYNDHWWANIGFSFNDQILIVQWDGSAFDVWWQS